MSGVCEWNCQYCPSFRRWSDGVPTEGVSGVAVLSRIAMMALIRAKAIQFEDCIAIPKRFLQVRNKVTSNHVLHGKHPMFIG